MVAIFQRPKCHHFQFNAMGTKNQVRMRQTKPKRAHPRANQVTDALNCSRTPICQ